jgi:hypothetical protein
MRKFRAVVILAALWALPWFALGIGTGIIFTPNAAPDVVPPPLIFFPIALAIWGGFSGAVFATVLALVERRHSLATLPLARVSLWGALACLIIPVVIFARDVLNGIVTRDEWLPGLFAVGLGAMLGALCAGGTLVMARRAGA